MELTLAPADIPALLAHPALRAVKRKRPVPLRIIWHDVQDGALAQSGRAVAQIGGPGVEGWMPGWRLEALVPPHACAAWPQGAEPPVLGAAETVSGLDLGIPVTDLLAVAAFEGTVRELSADGADIKVMLIEGGLRAVAATQSLCRLVLSGPGATDHALALAQTVNLAVPPQSLAAQALDLAGRSQARRSLGPPLLSPELTVESGFAAVVSHLAGVILHYAPLIAAHGGPEPVHQMRVALRRLRSAILLFRRAVECPALEDVNQRLKALGQKLGGPRDWDVFTQGTGARIGAAFTEDAAVTALLAAAERRRLQGYAALTAYLAAPGFSQLGIALCGLATERPWRVRTPAAPLEGIDAEPAPEDRAGELQQTLLRHYAAKALDRRLTRLIAPGADLSALRLAELHDIRLHAKRLRYACEFFSPLFPGGQTRRFLRRMQALQERLGRINDGVVAQALMAELAQRSSARRYAMGVVRGYIAAQTGGGRRKIERSWQRLLRQEPFWQ